MCQLTCRCTRSGVHLIASAAHCKYQGSSPGKYRSHRKNVGQGMDLQRLSGCFQMCDKDKEQHVDKGTQERDH